MLSKPIAKPERTKQRLPKVILCIQSQLKNVFSRFDCEDRLWLKHAKCARDVHLCCGFTKVLDPRQLDLRSPGTFFCSIIFLVFWTLKSYYRSVFVMACNVFWFCDVLGGVKTMTRFCYSLQAKLLLNSFWWPWGCMGLLGGLLAGLGSLFHCFGRCPNHDDVLIQFISQIVPKLILVILEPFGHPGGISSKPLVVA